jgi:hypothetical protein
MDIVESGLQIFIEIAFRYAHWWVTPILVVIAWRVWVYYVTTLFISKMEWTTLEIKIPRNIAKSPLAMELLLINAFHQTGGTGNWFAKYWLGKVRMWFSLEMVSIEGSVHFFMRIPLKPTDFRRLVEAQIYAQYPGVEIHEVPDYTESVPPFAPDNGWGLWGCEFGLSKADPYPIKTYVDYGLDKNATSLEAEQQTDPLTSLIEFMGSMGKGEQLWYQIIIRAAWDRHAHEESDKGWFQKRSWTDVGKEEMHKLLKRDPKTLMTLKGPDEKAGLLSLSKGEQEVVNAIERSINKPGFDAGVRMIYLAKKENFSPIHITGLTGAMKPYNSVSLNGFKVQNGVDVDYVWQDITKTKAITKRRRILEAYRKRGYFYPPFGHKDPIVLTSEELATIYHFPSGVSETPSFKRIESKKAEAPNNLPI